MSNHDPLRTATCLWAGFGFSVWRKRGLNTTSYIIRENGYVSSIDDAHARTLAARYGFAL